MAAKLTPIQTCAQNLAFVARCCFNGLRHRLPLRWPTPPDTPSSPRKAYRSHYVYLGWEDGDHPATWEHLSDFDLTLRLVDFGGLRPVLAQLLGWTSARGWKPFDPLSIFLLLGWQITNGWNRAQTLRHLHNRRYADYAQRFGFQEGVFPTEGGLRHWLTTIGQNSTSEETILVDQEQQVQVAIQRLNHLLAQPVILESGILSPEAWENGLLCLDGMLHDAASRMRCASVQESCYQPTPPAASAWSCSMISGPPTSARRTRRCLVAPTPLLLPHSTDHDKTQWPIGGYDDKGRPICPFGYALQANGFDFNRHRHKWACFHACHRGAPPAALIQGATYPPPECPYLAPDHPFGQIINVGERFKDHSIRLVRDLPVGTPAWKRIYHRARNASEGRNATLAHWGFKRLPV